MQRKPSPSPKLHGLVTALGICDGEMSQGSLRFDVNISVRRPGEPLGTRTETKTSTRLNLWKKPLSWKLSGKSRSLKAAAK